MSIQPAVYLDSNRRVVIKTSQTGGQVNYVQHVSGTVDVHGISSEKFEGQYTAVVGGKPVSAVAENLLNSAKQGVTVTPAARFALQSCMQVQPPPTTQEGSMPIPTKLKELPLATARVVSGNPKPKAKAEPLPEVTHSPLHRKGENEPPEMQVITTHQEDVTTEESELVMTEVTFRDQGTILVPCEESPEDAIINKAKAQADEMLAKAKKALVIAQAQSEAAKILDAAKKECEKISATIAALAGKGKAPDCEKQKRPRVDITGKVIQLITEPPSRAGSARGELATAVCNCTTTDEALEFAGVTPSFILRLVSAGYIALEDLS